MFYCQMGTRIFSPTAPRPTFVSSGYQACFVRRSSVRGVNLIMHLHLVLWLTMHGVLPSLLHISLFKNRGNQKLCECCHSQAVTEILPRMPQQSSQDILSCNRELQTLSCFE